MRPALASRSAPLRAALAAAFVLLGSLDTASAVRVLEDLENSVELALSHLDLPAAATGTVNFKACAGCPRSAHRLTSATTYVVNGTELTFVELMRTVTEIHAIRNGAEQTLAGVFFDLRTGSVTRIALHTRAR